MRIGKILSQGEKSPTENPCIKEEMSDPGGTKEKKKRKEREKISTERKNEHSL